MLSPSLNDEQYAQFYLVRKQRSTFWKIQGDWLKRYAKLLVKRKGKALNILSIGSGEGDVDFAWINALQNQGCDDLLYDFVEPNKEH